jgi:glucose-1-phosphate adenylyltransferase
MTQAPSVLAFVLAGGAGTRLQPLTATRCKPAVSFHGKVRLVDFVLSNLVNSGIASIAVLVQHQAHTLSEHVRQAWHRGGPRRPHAVALLPPPMHGGRADYRGTADAVYQNADLIRRMRPDIVAVFGADHVYRMDVRQMIAFHREQRAGATVAAIPVPLADAGRFGILEIDADRRIRGFSEKPAAAQPMPGSSTHAAASMGNYLFDPEVLLQHLERMHQRGETDFGRHLLPAMLAQERVMAYDFATNQVPGLQPWEERGYWRDVGTVDAYYRAHLDTRGARPKFRMANRHWPIHTDPGAPAADAIRSEHRGCIVSEGSRIDPAARVRRAIVEEDNDIPAGESIGFDPAQDRRRFPVTDGGVVIVPGGYFPPRTDPTAIVAPFGGLSPDLPGALG